MGRGAVLKASMLLIVQVTSENHQDKSDSRFLFRNMHAEDSGVTS